MGPGISDKVMTPSEAIRTLRTEIERRENLKIVGISGPGEPLYNKETFSVLTQVRNDYSDLHICISTNGLLLEEKAQHLANVGVDTISVSMSAIRLETVDSIYNIGELEQSTSNNIAGFQLNGIKAAVELGMHVKVNTILIPKVNMQEIGELAAAIRFAGAEMQNIVPLVPRGNMANILAPDFDQLLHARLVAGRYIPQFKHCRQCRSDVVGIPGCDTIL